MSPSAPVTLGHSYDQCEDANSVDVSQVPVVLQRLSEAGVVLQLLCSLGMQLHPWALE